MVPFFFPVATSSEAFFHYVQLACVCTFFSLTRSEFTAFRFLFTHTWVWTSLILAVCRTRVTCEPGDGVALHIVLCSSVVKHYSAESERSSSSVSYGNSEFFFCSSLIKRTKHLHSFFISISLMLFLFTV